MLQVLETQGFHGLPVFFELMVLSSDWRGLAGMGSGFLPQDSIVESIGSSLRNLSGQCENSSHVLTCSYLN